MSRLIDADKLNDVLDKEIIRQKRNGYFNCVIVENIKKEFIENAPTVDIVLCKDCKYWEVDTYVGFCVRTEDCDWTADDFCSKGEKR